MGRRWTKAAKMPPHPRDPHLAGEGMASARSQEIAEDAVDLYHRPVKAVLLPLLALYCASYATGLGHRAPDIDTTLEGSHLNCSADVGLCMTFHTSAAGSTQQWLLRTHAVAAVALCCSVVAQKELVRRIALGGKRGQRQAWAAHRQLGYATLATTLLMDGCGYLMAPASAFADFQSFAVLFAAPWVCFVVLIAITGRRAAAAGRNVAEHRLCGNMLVKAALSTPVSRLGGSVLQRQSGWDIERGYYYGIFGVTAVVSVWQGAELLAYWRGRGKRKRQMKAR